MTKRKIALLILIAMLVNLMQVVVFATESSFVDVSTINAGKVFTSDNGNAELNEDVSHTYSAVRVMNGGNLTIKGGNIKGLTDPTDGFAMAVWARDKGTTVTIKGGNFTNEPDPADPTQSDLIDATHGAHIVIEGGTFKCATPNWTLNCGDKSGSTITVKGGRFYKFNPAIANYDSSYGDPDSNTGVAPKDSEPEIIVPLTHKVVRVDEDWFEVVPVESIEGGKVYTSADGNAELNADVSYSYSAVRSEGGNLTITGGNIKGLCSPNGGNAMAVWARGEGSIITIKGGNFTNEPDPAAPTQSDMIYASGGGKIIIEGGTFKCATPQWTLNCHDTTGSTITVKGGRFYQFDPSNTKVALEGVTEIIVHEDYKVVQDGDWYEVVCAHKTGKTNAEKPATYAEVGTKAHWVCDTCSKTFEDATAKKEIKDLVIPKLAEVVNNNADVTEDAFDVAIKESALTNSSTVVIPVVETEKTVNSVTVPVASLTDVAKENKELSIQTSQVTATMDVKAIEKIVEQAGNVEDIKIEIIKVDENTLNKDQKKAIKNKSVSAIISAEIIANGKTISDFGGGKVKLEIPFTPEKNTKTSDYKVIYIADNGDVTEIPTTYKDGKLVVELEHFSEYAIVNVAKKVSSQASTGAAPAAPVKDVTPKTGSVDMSLVVISLIGTIALAGVVVIKKYSK